MARAPGVSVESNTEQSVSNSTTTNVSFAAANWEEGSAGWFDSGSPAQITVPTDGLFLLSWSVFCQAGNGSGLRRAYVTVNGNVPAPLCEDRCAASSQAITLNGSVQLELANGDVVQIKFWHNDGDTLKIGSTTSTYRNRLEVVKISDLT